MDTSDFGTSTPGPPSGRIPRQRTGDDVSHAQARVDAIFAALVAERARSAKAAAAAESAEQPPESDQD